MRRLKNNIFRTSKPRKSMLGRRKFKREHKLLACKLISSRPELHKFKRFEILQSRLRTSNTFKRRCAKRRFFESKSFWHVFVRRTTKQSRFKICKLPKFP